MRTCASGSLGSKDSLGLREWFDSVVLRSTRGEVSASPPGGLPPASPDSRSPNCRRYAFLLGVSRYTPTKTICAANNRMSVRSNASRGGAGLKLRSTVDANPKP